MGGIMALLYFQLLLLVIAWYFFTRAFFYKILKRYSDIRDFEEKIETRQIMKYFRLIGICPPQGLSEEDEKKWEDSWWKSAILFLAFLAGTMMILKMRG